MGSALFAQTGSIREESGARRSRSIRSSRSTKRAAGFGKPCGRHDFSPLSSAFGLAVRLCTTSPKASILTKNPCRRAIPFERPLLSGEINPAAAFGKRNTDLSCSHGKMQS
jgi:hypothetical protein